LGTSTSKEGREYFANLEKHRKDFIWVDDQDGDAIELAFSKKKIEERKNWLRRFEVKVLPFFIVVFREPN
jgi:DNA topoisomerase-2